MTTMPPTGKRNVSLFVENGHYVITLSGVGAQGPEGQPGQPGPPAATDTYVYRAGDTMTGPLVMTNNVDTDLISSILFAKPDAATRSELQLYGGVWNTDFDDSSPDSGVRLGGSYLALESTDISVQLNSAQAGSRVIVAGLTERGNAILGVEPPPTPIYVVQATNSVDVTIYTSGSFPSPWLAVCDLLTVAMDVNASKATIRFELLVENNGNKAGDIEIGISLNGLPPTATNSVEYTVGTGVKQIYAGTMINANPIPNGTTARLVARAKSGQNGFKLYARNSQRPSLLKIGVLESEGGVGVYLPLAGGIMAGPISFGNVGINIKNVTTALSFSTNSSERMRLDNAGNLEIGTTATALAKLHVNGDVYIGNNTVAGSTAATGTQKLTIGGNSVNGVGGELGWAPIGALTGDVAQITASLSNLGINSQGFLAFRTNGGGDVVPTERMRLDAGGRLGIGLTNATHRLSIAGAGVFAYANGAAIRLNNTTTGRFALIDCDDSQFLNIWNGDLGTGAIRFITGSGSGNERMRLDSTGNLGISVIPQAWNLTYRAIELQDQGNAIWAGGGILAVSQNTYYNNSSQFIRVVNAATSSYHQSNGTFAWYSDLAGTAGAVYAPTRRMVLDYNGALGIGMNPTGTYKLMVNGTGTFNSILCYGSTPYIAFDAGTSGSTEAWIQLDTTTHDFSIRSTNTAGYITFRTAAGSPERMRIDSGGNVLIGTITSASVGSTAISVNGATASSIDLRVADAKIGQLFANASGLIVETPFSSPLLFRTNSIERMRVDANGNLGIGVVPGGTYLLEVAGKISGTNLLFSGTSANGIGGVTGYSGFASALSLTYLGSGGGYGLALKPNTTTANTNAITFLKSTSSAGAGVLLGAIQHLVNDSGLNLTGTWQLNGVPFATTDNPTFTGDITISNVDPALYLDTTANAQPSLIVFKQLTKKRWEIGKDNTLESGTSTDGSNFVIYRYNDAEVNTGTAFRINRSSGNIGINNAPAAPYANLQVAGSLAIGNVNFGSVAATGTQKVILGGNPSNGIGGEIGWYPNASLTGDLAQITALATNFGNTSAGALIFRTNSGSDTAPGERMRLDSNGHIGLSCTPLPWSTYRSIQFNTGGGGAIFGDATSVWLSENASYTGSWIRTATGLTAAYGVANGSHVWYADASGAAGTFTPSEIMRIGSSGLLGIGLNPTNTHKLQVAGNIGTQGNIVVTGASPFIAFDPNWASSTEAYIQLNTSTHDLAINSTNAAGIITFHSAGTSERMRLDANANLGIGLTAASNARLNVMGNVLIGNIGIGSTPAASTQKLVINGNPSNGVGGELGWYVNGTFTGDVAQITASAQAFGTNSAGYLAFRTNSGSDTTPTERMRINSSGAIGINGANYGTSGQALVSGGTSAPPSWTTISGAPGGSTTQIQFNDAGSFGGDADFAWDKTANTLTFGSAGGTATIQGIAGGSNVVGTNLIMVGGAGTGVAIGGSLTLKSGAGGTAGAGGPIALQGGLGGSTNGTGGAVSITAGNGAGSSSANGGSVTINSGAPSVNGGTVGAITIQPAANVTSGVGGVVNIIGGQQNIGNGGANGGAVNITGGQAGPTQGDVGGLVTISGGNSAQVNGLAGSVIIQGGTPTNAGGGAVTIKGSNAVLSGAGGAVSITAGNSISGSAGPSVTIKSGNSGTGAPGNISLQPGSTGGGLQDGGVIYLGAGVTISTGAVQGHVFFPQCAGKPSISFSSGQYQNMGAAIFDTTNARLWWRAGSAVAWRPVSFQGIGKIFSVDTTPSLEDADPQVSFIHPSSDANARTFTIPANATVAFPIGSQLVVVNDSTSAVTIAITTDTLVLSGAGTTGNRTLAQFGIARIRKIDTARWYIDGTNIT
jgi:hypothetical protein